MKRAALVIFFLLSAIAAQAAIEVLPDPQQEARAATLGDQLRCVVCQSESINDSQADMARDMRILVREKIAQGWSDQQVIEFARARYGDFILLKPPVQANTYVLWGLPVFLVLLAVALAVPYFRPKKGVMPTAL